MTAATATTTTTSLDAAQLIGMGFSQEQVSLLQQLKSTYSAFSEQFETAQEFQQVQFLKWRYENGEVERG